ncbi:MAG: YidC/Oxa1 family membrane protein insertase [Bacilli bacterium]
MKKLKKLLVVFLLVFLLTGCTNQLVVEKTNSKGKKTKEVIKYTKGKNATGQALTKNILCSPTNKELSDIYKKNKVNTDKLVKCSNFTPTIKASEGLWDNLFIKPLAWIILKLGDLCKNYGLAVIITGALIRLAMFPITKKTAMQSENLKLAQPELTKLEKKYASKADDQQAMMQKSQEMMAIYKKYNISLFSGCIMAFIQLPLFIAFLEAINRTPAIFEGKFLGFQLGTTPLFAMSQGNYFYIILIVLIFIVTLFSLKLNSTAVTDKSNPATASTNMMMNVMIVVITISSFTLSTAVGLYWITSSLFTIIQNLLVKRGTANVRIKKA